MPKYVVSCDLLSTDEHYGALIDELKVLNAVRVSESTWILNSTLSVGKVARRLAPHVERMFVGELAGLASWLNPMSPEEDVRTTLR